MPHFGRHPGGPSARPPKPGGRDFNTIQRPDLLLRVQQFFGIRQAQVAPTLSPIVQPVCIIADLSKQSIDKPPLGHPSGPLRAAGTRDVAAVAGQRGRCKLRNPATSGVALRVRYVYAQHGAGLTANVTMGVVIGDTVGDLGGTASAGIDTLTQPPGRVSNLIPAQGVLSADTGALLGLQNFHTQVNPVIDMPIGPGLDWFVRLAPNDSLMVQTNVDALRLIVDMIWDEEPLAS